jgi:chromosome segregation ATPase
MKKLWMSLVTFLALGEGFSFEKNADGTVNLLEEHVDAMATKSEEFTTKVNQLTTDLATATKAKTDAETELATIKADKEAAEAKVTDLETKLQSATAELTTAKEALSRRPTTEKVLITEKGAGEKTFAELSNSFKHNQEIDKILGKRK